MHSGTDRWLTLGIQAQVTAKRSQFLPTKAGGRHRLHFQTGIKKSLFGELEQTPEWKLYFATPDSYGKKVGNTVLSSLETVT